MGSLDNFRIKCKMPIFRVVYHYITARVGKVFFVLQMKQKIAIRSVISPIMRARISRVVISSYYLLYSYLSYTKGVEAHADNVQV